MKMGRKLEEQAGKVYNNIEVIRHDCVRRGRNYWLCKCHCGKLFTTLVASLKTGSTKSCGCYRDKLCRERGSANGLSKHYLYRTYRNMINRCTSIENGSYEQYGGRGIRVCDRWLEPEGQGFLNFLEDMGERPEGASLDRVNTNGDYSPTNCRWTDAGTQSFNQRKQITSGTVRVGVRYDPLYNKWRSSINFKGKAYHLYYGPSLELAIKAREEAELKYYGEVYKYEN